ncbi:MAG: hypothetical protein HOP28_09400 [Gemmatimonadales bacterium]|nr:hypothetical protein [Gemmatimonadales bacterium]
MRRLLPLLLCAAITARASAQLHPEDSLAVVQTVTRFHAALEVGDTTVLRGMLAPGAVILKRGEVTPLRGDGLQAEIRWARAVKRGPAQITARVLGWGAFVYSSASVEAKANPALIQGTEVESVVLSRLGRTWFIELIHTSLGSTN